jgi:hypothetical protein
VSQPESGWLDESQDQNLSESAADRWRQLARERFPEASRELVDKAVTRLVSGDVSQTRHGTRISVRPDLGDDRSASGAGAWWLRLDGPRREWKRCLCQWRKRTGEMCSHELAARLLCSR